MTSHTRSTKGLLSLILLSYQSEARLEMAVRQIAEVMRAEDIPFEIVIIDDGSTDRSAQIARELETEYDFVRFFQLSRNFTSPYAQFAGLAKSNGDCSVFVPDDFQRPLTTIVKMYRAWQEGHKLVINYRESRDDGRWTDWLSNNFYAIMNRFSSIKYPPGGADGFLADREIIDIINERIHPINTSLTAEVLRMGFDPHFIPSPRPKSKGKSRWTFKKKMKLASDIFFASSSFPIKLITYLGLSIFLLSLILLPVIIVVRFFGDNTIFGFNIPGWTTIIFILFLFNGLILLSLGIVAEYIWRIFEEVKDRPGYIIEKHDEK